MFPIVKKRVLNETVTLMEIEAPLVARKALPGQFIIFRIDEEGERIPLTIADFDRERGTITLRDRRLVTQRYGKAILNALPPFRREIS